MPIHRSYEKPSAKHIMHRAHKLAQRAFDQARYTARRPSDVKYRPLFLAALRKVWADYRTAMQRYLNETTYWMTDAEEAAVKAIRSQVFGIHANGNAAYIAATNAAERIVSFAIERARDQRSIQVCI